jgi:hypothetical protein
MRRRPAKKPLRANNNIAPEKPAVMQPFRFHKAIEVSPGQTYDVLSWGRGATQDRLALCYGPALRFGSRMKYTTTTGDLDGTITDVYQLPIWILDGNPEILIPVEGEGHRKLRQSIRL